jgi:preprotein translocase subunit SecF
MNKFQRLYSGTTQVDFLGRRKLWFGISGAILFISLASLVLQGFNYGIEFAGGVSIQAPIDEATVDNAPDAEVASTLRSELRDIGYGEAQIQVATEATQRSIIVQTGEIPDPREQQEVRDTVARTIGSQPADTTFQSIGRKWGQEITEKAVRALIIFLLVILAYMAWQFEWKMGIAAIIALGHDLIITAGIYSLIGFEVTPSTVIAILTILGYSLYDTVVVFDKVEEETKLHATSGKMTYEASANLAMNSVFARSINTSLTTLIPIGALLFIGAGLTGAETMKDLALALFIGILAGTYSSIFVATPILSLMKEKEPRYKNVREKVLRDAKRAAAAPVMGTSAPETAARPADPGAERVSKPAARPAPRQRAGTKKAKRRKKR